MSLKKVYEGLKAEIVHFGDSVYTEPYAASGCWAITVYTESTEYSAICTETTNWGGNYGELYVAPYLIVP